MHPKLFQGLEAVITLAPNSIRDPPLTLYIYYMYIMVDLTSSVRLAILKILPSTLYNKDNNSFKMKSVILCLIIVIVSSSFN